MRHHVMTVAESAPRARGTRRLHNGYALDKPPALAVPQYCNGNSHCLPVSGQLAHPGAGSLLHRVVAFHVCIITIGSFAAHAIAQDNGTPNIIYFMADDMGYGDIGVYNAQSKIPTPNLDRLANEGLRFTDAHSPASVCTPTRYGVLTGRYAWRTRLQTNIRLVGTIRGAFPGQAKLQADDITPLRSLRRS